MVGTSRRKRCTDAGEIIPGLFVFNETIFNKEADAIVISANPSMDQPMGSGLDHEVYTKAGVEHLIEARNEALRGRLRLENGDIFVTDAGIMVTKNHIKHIIHVVVPSYKREYRTRYKDRNLSFLESIIEKVFRCAKKEGFKDVSLPLLGTAALGFKPEDVMGAIEKALLSVRESDGTYFNECNFTVKVFCLNTKRNRGVKREYPQLNELLKMLDALSVEVPDFEKMPKKKIEFWVENLDRSLDELKEHGMLAGRMNVKKCESYMLDAIFKKLDNGEKVFHSTNRLYELIKKYMDRLTVRDEKNRLKKMNDTILLQRIGLEGSGLISKLKKNTVKSIKRETVIKLAVALELSEDEAVEFIGIGSPMQEFPASHKEWFYLECIKKEMYNLKEIEKEYKKHYAKGSKANRGTDDRGMGDEEIEK